MEKKDRFEGMSPPPRTDAVGIVVSDGGRVSPQPRTIAFVWGQRVRSAPSLPYGRWKQGVRSAA